MTHICHAIGCNTPISPKLLMCLGHWRMVPGNLKTEVLRTYRAGQEIRKDPSAEYLVAANAAIDAVAAKEAKRDAPSLVNGRPVQPPPPRNLRGAAPRVYNLRVWAPDDAVYIGRPGRTSPGPWGNPVVLGAPCPRCEAVHTRDDVEAACECYRALLLARLDREPAFASGFDALRGQNLRCFCAPTRDGLGASDPLRCHGQVMLQVLAERGTP